MSKYRIHAVAQLTGLSAALIRAWESRYQLVTPLRSASGYRLYSDEDVAVLQRARQRVADGMAPMEVAALGRAALLAPPSWAPGALAPGASREIPTADPAAADLSVPAADLAVPAADLAAPAAARSRDGAPDGSGSSLWSGPGARLDRQVEPILRAMADFDKGRLEELLGPPLAMLPVEVVCRDLLLPLLREIGARWHQGRLSVAAEHFGTNVVRGKLLLLLDSLRHRGGLRRIVCACPPGEQHEIGLMMFAVQAAAQGWEAIYLGPDLPLSGLRDAALRTRPNLVALSLVARSEADALRRLVAQVVVLLAEVAGARLLIGGQGVVGLEDVVQQAGGLMLPASGRLDDL